MNDWDKKPLLRASEEGLRPVQLSILGEFVLSHSDGRQFPIATKKNRALLAVLALSPGFQATRERLCGLLWDDRGEDQARSSLRQSLAVLRKELGDVEDLVLKTHDDIVALRRDTAQVDAIDFLALSNDSGITTLRQAAKLYRGELLGDTSIRDAAFEDWLSAERSRLRTVAIKIFDRLIPLEEGHSRIVAAQQLVSFDPLRESSHRLLMQAYADQGDNGLALKQFELCRKLLNEELSVEPAAETQALRTAIAKGTLSKAEAAAGASKGEGFDRSPPVPADKPSIAVLPFANLTGDPHQDFLCDGISQNITDDLARFHDLVVIASDSAFVYRNRNTSIQAMSQDLGARYLLQGSVVTSGNHLRIQARLVDGKSGQQLWSESYDGHPDSIFSLQDSVTKTIASTLATAYGGRLLKAWERRADRAATRNMQAIDLFQRGMQSLNRFTKEDNETARQLFQEAAQHDPNYAKPLAKGAWTHIVDCLFGWSSNPQASLQASLELARKAVSTDSDEPWAYWALSGYYQHEGDFERAIAGYEKALELNPNDADVVTDYGWCLSFAGRAEEGLAMAQKAMMLNPHHPDWYIFQFAQLQFNAKKYRDAVNTTKRLREVDTASAQLYLAASYAALGEAKNARMAVTRALELDPQASIERHTSRNMAQYQVEADLDHFRDFLRKAGLPKTSNSSLARMDEKPSIAVLPFTNLSGDPQQDYFASGVSDDLVLALSRFQEIRVLQADASNGSSTLQKLSDGNSLTKQADFILSGSIRKNGDRIRITVQLRSTRSSQVCWTDQYDRHTHDIFAVHDEIVEACAYNIVNKINTETLQALQLGRTENLSAYELFIQGRSNAYKQNEESTLLAAQLLQNAIQLDSHFAAAHAWLAETIWVAWWAGWRDDKNTALSAALNHARMAIEFDNSDPHGFAELGQAYLYQGEFSLAQGAIERSLFLNPNNPDAMIIYSFYWLYMGDAEKAHDVIQSAIRRDPNGHYGVVLGIILYILGRWGESVAALRHVRAKFHSVDAWLAAALAMNGDQIAARAATDRYLANQPPSSYVGEAATFILERNPFKAQKDIELVRDGLTKAGL